MGRVLWIVFSYHPQVRMVLMFKSPWWRFVADESEKPPRIRRLAAALAGISVMDRGQEMMMTEQPAKEPT